MSGDPNGRTEGKGGRGGRSRPVLIDLTGKGQQIDTLQASQAFFDFEGDGYQRRTAWAGSGTGVLVFDADGDGKISRSSEFAFTEWAQGTDSDLEALRRVFDTNNNNKLDAGDSRWADFKIWLGGSLVTLASQNIASIDLIAKGSGQSFEDGSAITGTSIFTRIDGTTGQIGDAVLATETEENDRIVRSVTVTNADSSKITTIAGYQKDGSLAIRNVVTRSASGLSVTTQFDDDGDGVFDRSQSDVTSETSGVVKRIVSNFQADGSLKDRTTTTTSADRNTVTTEVDQDGDGTLDQSQIYQRSADGSSITTVTQLSVSGAVLKRVQTTSSADGLTKTIRTDADGNGTYERAETRTTTVAADGGRTTTMELRGLANNLIRRQVTVTSADGQTTTVETDIDGSGAIETRTRTVVAIDAAGATGVTRELLDATDKLLTRSVTTTSKDGLTKSEALDLNGDGSTDLVRSDATVMTSGAMTRTVTEKSASGVLLNAEVTATSADRKTITVERDADGDGKIDARSAVLIDAQGVSTSTKTLLAANNATISKTVTVTSADGLSETTRADRDGNGTDDRIVADVTTGAADGSRTRTVTTTSANGTLVAKTATTTTANGLVETVREDRDADGTYDLVTVDATQLNADGSRLNTVTKSSANGTLQSKVETLTSADRKTLTVRSDGDGDGKLDETRTSVTRTDGSRLDTLVRTAASGVTLEKTETTISGDGLTKTTKRDLNGDGTFDTTTTAATVLGTDGSRTTTETTTPSGNASEVMSRTVTIVSSTGMKTETKMDADGDGVFETSAVEQTFVDVTGAKIQLSSLLDSTGLLLSRTAVMTSASELVTARKADRDGDGAYERMNWEWVTPAADGSRTKTLEVRNASSVVIARQGTSMAANGHDVTETRNVDNAGKTDMTRAVAVAADGTTTTVTKTFDATNKLLSQSTETVTANGLGRTVAVDMDGNGTTDRSTSETTVLNADGSRTETFSDFGSGSSLLDRAIVTTSANGLTKRTVWTDGAGLTKRSLTEAKAIKVDGAIEETLSFFKADGSLESRIVKTTAAGVATVTMTRDLDGDGVRDGQMVTSRLADGSTREVFTDYGTGSVVKAVRTVTTTADGLSRTEEFDTDGNGTLDKRVVATTVLNVDGNRTQTTSSYAPGTSGWVLKTRAVTDISADGFTVAAKWDTTGGGTFGKSRTDVTVLGADGAKTQTLSSFTGTTLASREEMRASANGLAVTKRWDLSGSGTFGQILADVTVPNADGITTRTVTATKSDGTLLSKVTATTSANGRIATSVIEETGQAGRTATESEETLADGAVRATRLIRLTASSQLLEKTVTTTSADKRRVTIERDANGDGTVDQREERVKGLSGEETVTVTTLVAGAVKDRMTVLRSADGRRTTTTYDRDGNGATDRTRVVDETTNLDGSRVKVTTDTDLFTGKPASKATTRVSADGLLTMTERDIDGDGTLDQTEEVRVDPTGATTTVLLNKTALARNASTRPSGTVQWRELVAERIETATSADGRSTVSTFSYAEDKAGVVTRTTAVMRQTLQIDGSVVTQITETNAAGTTIATGRIVTTMDGQVSVLTKDTDANGTIDRRETSVTALDGSMLLTKVDLKADGSASGTVSETVNALGSLVSRVTADANGRKTLELVMAADGSATQTSYDGPSGSVLSVTKLSKTGLLVGNTLYDPLGKQTWSRVEQQFDAAGNKNRETQFNDDGTRYTIIYDSTGAQTWSRLEQAFDTANRLTTQLNYNDDGSRVTIYYDAAAQQNWKEIYYYYDAASRNTHYYQFADDNSYFAITYDVAGQYQWSRVQYNYDTLRRVAQQTNYNDDGSQFNIYYDVSGQYSWREHHQTNLANGRLVSSKTFFDDGQLATYDEEVNPIYEGSYKFSSNQYDSNGRVSINYSGTAFGNGILNITDLTDYYYSGSITKITYASNGGGNTQEVRNYHFRHTVYENNDAYTTYRYDGYTLYAWDKYQYGMRVDYWRLSNQYPSWAPVILDLDSDSKLHLLTVFDAADGASFSGRFDWDGDSEPDSTAWVGPGDAFLAIDLAPDGSEGSDGQINQARELAFSLWPDPEDEAASGSALTDFDGLRLVFDTNHDNVLSALDERWGEFRIWQDLNQNGTSEASELKTLSEAGIALMNLVPSTDGARTFSDGSMITGTSFYQTTDGRQHLAGDAALAWRPANATPV